MKKFTQINEATNPGNSLNKTGVTNHYTPIENILVNINNLFCARLSIAACKGEDEVSIKLSSSKFGTEKKVDELINCPLYNDVNWEKSSLYGYITSCGLTKVTKIDLGGYFVVYFSPEDIKTAESPYNMVKANVPYPTEANESVLYEFEMNGMIKEDDEEEMKSATVEKVLELLDGPDKVKAAKQLEQLVLAEIQLPREFYFRAVKFKSGEEAIALRWKYTKKMPFGKSDGEEGYKETTVENTRSIMHIFGKGDQAIWVQDYDKESIVQLPDEVKKLIDSILELLEAGKTDNPAVYKLTGEPQERDDDNKDENDENQDENSEDKDEKKDKKDKKEKKDKGGDDLLGGSSDKSSKSDEDDNDDDLL